MIRINQLKLEADHTKEDLERAIAKHAQGRKPDHYRIVRRSVDARKKPKVYYSYTIDASFDRENRILSGKKSRWTKIRDVSYRFPVPLSDIGEEDRPLIVGMGPAGLFAGLVLARAGFRPILLERGEPVEDRTGTVEHFFQTGKLDPESNVQFGEGGAGTFSDGKLNSMVKDKDGRNRFVLEEFVRHGAAEEILYDAKPHIGTDVLAEVVASMRREIISLGGEVHFRTRLDRILTKETSETSLCGLHVTEEGKSKDYPCRAVILAIGHSARDTFSMLLEEQVEMKPKSFAIGVRVEHAAKMINESQYGPVYAGKLPAASYKLTHQCKNGRGVYSFCMCPGGYVVNSSSEPGCLCVNGMSYQARDGENSNSAIITTVTPEDYGSDHPLAGVEFQRKYEKLAFSLAGGKVPVQRLEDFILNRTGSVPGPVKPCIKGEYAFANLRDCLPDYVAESLEEGMKAFGKKIAGYDDPDTMMAGVESRTSSPVRIQRDVKFQSNIRGLYPCGEGAGYAGGITSAAMDGIKVAEAVAADIIKATLKSESRERKESL